MNLAPILWVAAAAALIPMVLWLYKRSAAAKLAARSNFVRHVATLSLAPNQKIVTVEVGEDDARCWLVLGVTPHNITTLHMMEPQGGLPPTESNTQPFAQLVQRMRHGSGDGAP